MLLTEPKFKLEFYKHSQTIIDIQSKLERGAKKICKRNLSLGLGFRKEWAWVCVLIAELLSALKVAWQDIKREKTRSWALVWKMIQVQAWVAITIVKLLLASIIVWQELEKNKPRTCVQVQKGLSLGCCSHY
jgi:hypothetical protein